MATGWTVGANVAVVITNTPESVARTRLALGSAGLNLRSEICPKNRNFADFSF
jgi:hypothetical protein